MPANPGDLILVRRPALGSKLIAWGQRRRFPSEYAYWSHAGIMLSRASLAEALGGGVVISPLDKYAGIPYTIIDIPMSEYDRRQVVRFAMHGVGERYGFTEIFSQGLYLLSGTAWRICRNNQLICSAFAAEALCRTGAIFPEEPLWCTPAHLAQYYNAKAPG